MRHTHLGLIALICLASCKQEKAPQPKSDKTGSNTSTNTQYGYQTGTGYNTSTYTPAGTSSSPDAGVDLGDGTPVFYVDGTEATQVAFNSTKTSAQIAVRAKDGSKTYKIHLVSEAQNIQITGNDSESATVTYGAPQQSGAGTLTVIARDTAACDSAGGTNCSGTIPDTASQDYDKSLNLSWMADPNGTASGVSLPGLSNYGGSGGNGNSGSNMAMTFGFQLLSQILGVGGGPQVLFGTNQGYFGGGRYNAQQVGAWGQQQYGCTDPYGNYVDPSYGNCDPNQLYGNQNGNYYNNQYGNYYNNQYGNYYNNQYGNQTGYGNQTRYGTQTCYVGQCASCTDPTACQNAGCRYTSGYCREPSGTTTRTGTCSIYSCESCASATTCRQQGCTWNSTYNQCSQY